MKLSIVLALFYAVTAGANAHAVEKPSAVHVPADEKLVTETHAASLELREDTLRKTIAKEKCFPSGTWGDNLWCLAALCVNEKVDEANARLLKHAQDYIASNPTDAQRISPESTSPRKNPEEKLPFTFFSVTDYVRTLYLFHSKSPQFAGRLKPETEAAMKESLWLWVRGESRLAETGAKDVLTLLGTENHDLNRRPAYYLITAFLKDDPTYRDRKLADGHTVAELADAYTAFYREWPRKRAETGLWAEVGSNTYQKYSWPGLFNLHELSPDPVIRRRFGLLLDLAFIEEEQISVHGRRGGGRSRAYPSPNAFESYKNLLYATKGQPAGSTHSRVIETSRYQLPPEAIYLRYRAFPATQPFVIRNRVLGELESPKSDEETGQRLAADSALVNYAYRTPHYLLGSTLQNPALSKPDPKTGKPAVAYSGISLQNRACGMLFDDPASDQICSVQLLIEHGSGGRPQHPFWSVQHENVLILSGTYYFHAKFKGKYPLIFREGQVALPSLLKSAGYHTAALGKWHNGFGREPEPDYNKELKPGPLEIGFDSFFGTPRTHSEPPLVLVQDHWVVGLDPADPISVDHAKESGAHGKQVGGAKAAAARPDDRIDLILADRAGRYFADQKPGQPFFLYLAFAAVHNPIDPAPEFRKKSKAGLYGDYAEQLDHCTGLVLDALEKSGLARDTLVIFTSDNGGRYENTAMMAGHRTNGELLGQKTDAWEGGHRVPCVARWPDRIPAGAVRKEFFVQVDLMATLAEVAGILMPAGASPDGSSELAAFLEPTTAPARRTEALLQGTRGIVLRQGDWIYFPKQGSLGYTAPEPERPFGVLYAKMGFTNSDIDERGQIRPGAPPEQLYNLAADLRQSTNLALKVPDRVREMRARFLELAGPTGKKTLAATD